VARVRCWQRTALLVMALLVLGVVGIGESHDRVSRSAPSISPVSPDTSGPTERTELHDAAVAAAAAHAKSWGALDVPHPVQYVRRDGGPAAARLRESGHVRQWLPVIGMRMPARSSGPAALRSRTNDGHTVVTAPAPELLQVFRF
jgi:hypothetical protein